MTSNPYMTSHPSKTSSPSAVSPSSVRSSWTAPRRRLGGICLLVAVTAGACGGGGGAVDGSAAADLPTATDLPAASVATAERDGDNPGVAVTVRSGVSAAPVRSLDPSAEVTSAYDTFVRHLDAGDLEPHQVAEIASGSAETMLLAAQASPVVGDAVDRWTEPGVVSVTIQGASADVVACDQVMSVDAAEEPEVVDYIERRASFDSSSGRPVITEFVAVDSSARSASFCVPPSVADELEARVAELEAASRRFAATTERSLEEIAPLVLPQALVDFEVLDRQLGDSAVTGASQAAIEVYDWLPGHLAVVAVCTTFPDGTMVVSPDGSELRLSEPGAEEGVAITLEWSEGTWLYRATEPANAC